ncbi:MAG: HAMP domain-containing histidine kinase [Candidatus Eisenbacteria bacterium]|nr:HAMP domain-containing histidine kinase [Candidatus Eisenbacteria bacterium]
MLKARAELDLALAELDWMPAVDPNSVAFAAHAPSNYLTVADGTVQLLLLSLAEHPDPQVQVWLEGLRHATGLMTHTVGQLMNTSASSVARLRFDEVDLSTQAQRACQYYRRIAEQKDVRIVCDASVKVPLVWADRVAVAAIFDNLLSNAVKYSSPRKSVRVEVRPAENGAICSVIDEGPGLSAEQQSKLFQPGVRLGHKPTAGEPSSGYGLAVAKELMDKLGGRIWCESEAGKGACFSFRLSAPGHAAQAGEGRSRAIDAKSEDPA